MSRFWPDEKKNKFVLGIYEKHEITEMEAVNDLILENLKTEMSNKKF